LKQFLTIWLEVGAMYQHGPFDIPHTAKEGHIFQECPCDQCALTDMKHQKMLVGVGILLWKMHYPGWRKSSTCRHHTLPIYTRNFLLPMLSVLQVDIKIK